MITMPFEKIETPVQETAVETPIVAEKVEQGTAENESVDGGATADTSLEKSDKPAEGSYTPDYTYKASAEKDGGGLISEKREFPEWVKPLVTSKEAEEKFRDILSKADGLDTVKAHRDILVGENQQLRGVVQQAAQLNQTAQYLQHQLKGGNMQALMDVFGIDDQRLFKFAMEKLDMLQNPQLANQHRQWNDGQYNQFMLQNQIQDLNSWRENMMVQMREQELQSYLSQPGVAEKVQQYDAARGQGSFRRLLIERGQYFAKVNQQDVPVHNLVTDTLNQVFLGTGTQSQSQTQGGNPGKVVQASGGGETPHTGGGKGVVVTNQKATLPRVKGSGASPVASKVKSVADLRKLAREKMTQGAS